MPRSRSSRTMTDADSASDAGFGKVAVFFSYATMRTMRKSLTLLFLPFFLLTGCDQVNQQLGLEDLAKKEARSEAEGKAVGSACRQSGRAIEDCYSIYGWLPKAAIYAGWREMDAYMRENQLETVAPQLPPPEAPGAKKKKKTTEEASSEAKPASDNAEKPAEKPVDKPTAKPPQTEKPTAKH